MQTLDQLLEQDAPLTTAQIRQNTTDIEQLKSDVQAVTAPLKYAGQWDVVANSPTLTQTPSIPFGSFYLIKGSGDTTIIDGTSQGVGDGGMLISAEDGTWDYKISSDAALILATALAEKLEDYFPDAYPGKRIFCDEAGNVIFQIDEQGVVSFAGQVTVEMLNYAVRALSNLYPELQPGDRIIADENGYVVFKITAAGVISYAGQVTQTQLQQVKDLANSVAENKYPSLRPGDRAYADENGNLGFIQYANGQVAYPGQVVKNDLLPFQEAVDKLSTYYHNLYPGHYYRCDVDGNVQLHVKPDGSVESTEKSTAQAGATVPAGVFDADIVQIALYGQSLSVGGTNTSPTDFYDSKVFAGGLLTNYNPDDTAARDAYYGSGLIAMPTNGVDAGKAAAKIIKELVRDENQIPMDSQSYTLLVNSSGDGGLSLALLSATSGVYYRRLMESVRKGKDFALAQGKGFAVGALVYLQGENTGDRTSSQTDWYNKLNTLFTNLNTAIKAITGQPTDVQFFTYQIASNMAAGLGVPYAQYAIAQDKANVHFGSAMYQYEYADSLHLTSASYRIMHAAIGVVAKRAMVDRKKQIPISPKSWTIQKNEASTSWLIQMLMNVPVAPLVMDETYKTYTNPVINHGFSIKNGATEIITSVTVLRGNTLNIVCSQNPAGLSLTYAIGGKDSGGHLRDSQGDKIKISCDGVIKRVDNWCPIFPPIIL